MLARRLLIPLLIALAGAFLVAAIGGALTDTGSWFRALIKPTWQPPDNVFGPVWTTLYALIAASAALAWCDARNGGERTIVVSLFVVNGILNVCWSLLFFHLQRPTWALAEIVILWLSTAFLIAVLWRFSRRAALLLVPYLAWLSFASALNFEIVRLNPL
jgi:benzodiazapine receptor